MHVKSLRLTALSQVFRMDTKQNLNREVLTYQEDRGSVYVLPELCLRNHVF